MRVLDRTFMEGYFEDVFGEYESDCLVSFRQENAEYNNLLDEKEKILSAFPNLRRIIEEEEAMPLTEAEVKALVEYLDLQLNQRGIESKEMFFKGICEAYHLFKRTKIIKK